MKIKLRKKLSKKNYWSKVILVKWYWKKDVGEKEEFGQENFVQNVWKNLVQKCCSKTAFGIKKFCNKKIWSIIFSGDFY